MKFKGLLSIILVICMLFSIQCVSVFANSADDFEDELNIVTLLSTFNEFKGEEMTTEDNVNFVIKVKLEAGRYLLNIRENGDLMGHPTTIKDTTDRISADGLVMSENVDARCTLLASGGNYTFVYNVESNLLNIKKDGVSAPADNGENLVVKAGNQQIAANVGDKIAYNIYLKASEIFEDIQLVVNYDASKLTLTDTTAEKSCPILFEPIFNTDIKGLVAANSSKIEGYDFKSEQLIVSLEFTVASAGEAYIDFFAQDMTILGGEKSYYFLSEKVTEGADFREEIKNLSEIVTEPTETTDTSNNETSPTTAVSDNEVTTPSTESAESTSTPDETNTDPSETTPATPDETISTEPSEPTTTVPDLQYEIGDVNRDGKLNIRDATLIQKVLAKLEQFDNEQLILADYFADGKVNIKDVTQIQKKLANLI